MFARSPKPQERRRKVYPLVGAHRLEEDSVLETDVVQRVDAEAIIARVQGRAGVS
jgi:hypothetical protein